MIEEGLNSAASASLSARHVDVALEQGRPFDFVYFSQSRQRSFDAEVGGVEPDLERGNFVDAAARLLALALGEEYSHLVDERSDLAAATDRSRLVRAGTVLGTNRSASVTVPVPISSSRQVGDGARVALA